MLEQMRRSSRSVLIYALFFIIILVFIVSFGPQSQGGCEPTAGSMGLAAKVEGEAVTSRDFRYGYVLSGGLNFQTQQARELRIKERVLDELIERELLVAEARRLGFRVDEHEVENLIADSKLVGLGGYEQAAPAFQKDGRFDYETFTRFVAYQLALTPKAFIEQQQRELLASRVRNLIRGGVTVSEEEVKSDYVRDNTQVNLEYMRFSWRRLLSDIEIPPAEIAAYAKEHEKELQALYDQRKTLYENVPKELKLRQILVKVDSGASEDATERAKKKAEALAARIKKGEAFEKVARAESEDPRTKAKGGALGWKRQGTNTFGAAVETQVWAAKDNEVVGPIKGNDGFYLVVSEASREGNITFDQVKLELAENQLREDKAKTRAKAEAETALAKTKTTPDKAWKALFPAPADVVPGVEGPAHAEETGLFSRRGAVVEGLGTAPELAKRAFELTKEDPYAGPLEVGSSFVVAHLKERIDADPAEFEKKKAALVSDAAQVRGEQVLAEWTLARCQQAKGAKKIHVNLELLRYEDMPQDQAIAYDPCTPPFRF